MKILAISGSLRKKSFNTALLRAAQISAPAGMDVDLFETLGEFPLYNQDVADAAFPDLVSKTKERIRTADGILFSTPEYNRGISGVLKNMIDWCSRPSGDGAWGEKPYGIMSASGGRLSAMRANYELKLTMLQMGGYVMGTPEFFLGNGKDVFDENMALADEKTKELLAKYLAAFKTYAERFSQKA
ncbi:MAG: hypothetical protein RLZZ416_73 [Candidatus Parcubacteria bacterium]